MQSSISFVKWKEMCFVIRKVKSKAAIKSVECLKMNYN